MKVHEFLGKLDKQELLPSSSWDEISVRPAMDLYNNHRAGDAIFGKPSPPLAGTEVAETYGLLAHYTTQYGWEVINEIGGVSSGCWLTPAISAACMVPYNLGLDSPRDVCLIVDVSSVSELWGPSTIPASRNHPKIWHGGGVEFYIPRTGVRDGFSILTEHIRAKLDCSPCSGNHETVWTHERIVRHIP